MLLEGKLMAGDGASRANTPFYVTVQKVRTTYHLKLSLMMSPAVIYTEAVSSELKTNYAKLVIRVSIAPRVNNENPAQHD